MGFFIFRKSKERILKRLVAKEISKYIHVAADPSLCCTQFVSQPNPGIAQKLNRAARDVEALLM